MVKKDSKILIIDDDESIRKVLTLTLQDVGYQVLTAADGEGGLKIFADERPDITLTDLRMPGMDGIEKTCFSIWLLVQLLRNKCCDERPVRH